MRCTGANMCGVATFNNSFSFPLFRLWNATVAREGDRTNTALLWNGLNEYLMIIYANDR